MNRIAEVDVSVHGDDANRVQGQVRGGARVAVQLGQRCGHGRARCNLSERQECESPRIAGRNMTANPKSPKTSSTLQTARPIGQACPPHR